MNPIKKLKELLNQYLDENKIQKDECNKKIKDKKTYEGIIDTIKNKPLHTSKIVIPVLLNTIYNNDIYGDEFIRILKSTNKKQELEKFFQKIMYDYNRLKEDILKLEERIKRNNEIVLSAQRVVKCLSLNTEISEQKNDISNVKTIINYFGISGIISPKEEVLLINEIELYNQKLKNQHFTEEEKTHTQSIYEEIPNILNAGFQYHDVYEIDRNRQITLDS